MHLMVVINNYLLEFLLHTLLTKFTKLNITKGENMKFFKKLVLSAFFISTLSLVGTSANAECKARLGDFDWSSANIHTAISAFILEKGYGCKVTVTKGSTTPIMAAHYDG